MDTAPRPSEDAPKQRPKSDVSSYVGLIGLAGLFAWVAVSRHFPAIADYFDLPLPRQPMSGPHSALAALVAAAVPMALWSVFIDKVHLRPSTGIDWSLRGTRAPDRGTSLVKLLGLWATWAVIAALYCLCRWYWDGNYVFAIRVLTWAALPLVVLSIPYVLWLDRVMVNPRDHAWHFGALILGKSGWDPEQIKKHWRAWIIKGFYTAFMISIVPFAFATVVTADLEQTFSQPASAALFLIEVMFMMDVIIGTVGYIMTVRPLDAHIRSGNPFLGGWIAALICYPPMVWGIMGNAQFFNYQQNTPEWLYWMQGNDALVAGWGALLVTLTFFYAWATVVFGLRFSNLTYRGVITHGPYRWTRHPAYVSKNLFWWCATLPFLVTTGNPVEMIRNTFFLLVVNGIYYWRARTEEAHLLREDAKYRAYHAWMAENGLITAPLTRLISWVRTFRPVTPPA